MTDQVEAVREAWTIAPDEAGQRLDVMNQKLTIMRRSLTSAASVLHEENKDDTAKKDDKSKTDTPLGRLDVPVLRVGIAVVNAQEVLLAQRPRRQARQPLSRRRRA